MKYRYLSERMARAHERRLIILTGARQTGKTTLARMCYPSLKYYNLDALEYRDLVNGASSFNWGRDIGNAVLDEAQKAPSVFDKVKYAYDEGNIDFTILLGSSQILLLKKVRESLAGRAFLMELWPLMLSEMTTEDGKGAGPPLFAKIIKDGVAEALSGIKAETAGPKTADVQSAEKHMLEWGGMPELLRLNNDQRREWLISYERLYLERDLADLARLDDLEPFRKFQKLASLRAGRLLNYSELARDAGVSVDTSRRYLEYLRLSYQAVLLQPWRSNATSAMVKSPKLYWIDTGLMRQTSGMGSADTGEIYENYVVSEVWKWCRTSGQNADLYFYRTRSGMEVDLLLESPQGIIGMEIKRRETAVQSDGTNLERLADHFGKRWLGGVVVYRGSRVYPISQNTWATPSWRLFGNLAE